MTHDVKYKTSRYVFEISLSTWFTKTFHEGKIKMNIHDIDKPDCCWQRKRNKEKKKTYSIQIEMTEYKT